MPEAQEIPTTLDDKLRSEAMQRARSKLEFFKHVVTYAVVIGILCAINLATGPTYLWFLWPAAGWGIGLLLHAVNVFVFSENVLRRMTERELGRTQHEPRAQR